MGVLFYTECATNILCIVNYIPVHLSCHTPPYTRWIERCSANELSTACLMVHTSKGDKVYMSFNMHW